MSHFFDQDLFRKFTSSLSFWVKRVQRTCLIMRLSRWNVWMEHAGKSIKRGIVIISRRHCQMKVMWFDSPHGSPSTLFFLFKSLVTALPFTCFFAPTSAARQTYSLAHWPFAIWYRESIRPLAPIVRFPAELSLSGRVLSTICMCLSSFTRRLSPTTMLLCLQRLGWYPFTLSCLHW